MKNKRLKRSFYVLIFLMSISFLNGETIDLDLSMAREITLNNNPTIKLAREGVRKSYQQISEARSGMLPVISAFSSVQHAWDLQENRIPNFLKEPFDMLNYNLYIANLIPTFEEQPQYIEMAFGLENMLVTGLDFKQPIFTGGIIRSGYQISKLGHNIALSQLKTTELKIITDLTTAYYSVLFAKSAVHVAEEALQSAQKNLDQVTKFYEVGKSSRFDVLRAEVQLANIKPQLISAKNGFRLAESRLRMIMGIDESVELNYLEKLELTYSELTEKSYDELIDIALSTRPEIAMMRDQKKISEKQVAIAKGAFMPSVIFGTSYQYQGQRDDFGFESGDFNKSFSSSISISIPLFNGMKNSSKLQQSKIALKEADYQAESVEQGIRLEVKAAYFSMQEALEKVQTQKKTIEQAKEAQRLARLMYSEGSSTQLDVLNADLAVQQAQMNYSQSLLEYNIALSNLKKAINQL